METMPANPNTQTTVDMEGLPQLDVPSFVNLERAIPTAIPTSLVPPGFVAPQLQPLPLPPQPPLRQPCTAEAAVPL